MRCKEEEDKVNVSKLNEVKQVQDDVVLCVQMKHEIRKNVFKLLLSGKTQNSTRP